MIAYARGVLTHIYDDNIVVDVQGIGYEIVCANPFAFQDLLNQEVLIYTYHYVREDVQTLFGFKTEDEKYLFMKLISVSGIGPKSGLAIQGNVSVSDFVAAIEREDEKYLMNFPGIGKKTARQIILDLKGQLTGLVTIAQMANEEPAIDHDKRERLNETKEALKALGYSSQEIKTIMPSLERATIERTDELVRKALTLLMKN